MTPEYMPKDDIKKIVAELMPDRDVGKIAEATHLEECDVEIVVYWVREMIADAIANL